MNELTPKAAGADEAAHLWGSFSGSLRAWFARRARGEQVDDLVQETFAHLLARIDELEGVERPAAWVQRIARNVWIDSRRRSRGAGELESDPLAPDDSQDLQSEVAGWLEPFVDAIDAEHALVLRRADLQGESQAAIAEDLGLSLSAVKSRVQRGREKVRKRLEACCRFEFDRRGGLLEVDRRTRSDGECDCA